MEGTDGYQQASPAGKILSLCWHSGTMAAAYYDIDLLELFAIQEAVEPNPQYPLMRDLVRQYRPLYYVVSGSSDFMQDCMEILNIGGTSSHKTNVAEGSDVDRATADDIHFHMADFGMRAQVATKTRVLALNLPGLPPQADETERKTFLQSVLPFGQRLLIHCVGNLLQLLDRVGEPNPEALVTKINLLAPSTQLTIDELTYEALQVFETSRHPSGFKRGIAAKGLSLFNHFNKCASSVGKDELARLMSRPIRDLTELNRRQATVQWLLDNPRLAEQINHYLMQLTNVSILFRRVVQRTARNSDWKLLKKNAYYLYMLCKTCATAVEVPGITGTVIEWLGRYVANNPNGLKQILYTLDRSADLEKGEEENKFVVKAGLDPTLDQTREQYGNLRELLLETSRLEMESHRIDMANVCVTYLPTYGFVISTDVDERLKESGIFENSSFDLVFQADNTAYFQISLCKDLNAEFGHLVGKMVEQELDIQSNVIAFVGQTFPEVLDVFRRAGKLDALLAFAKVAKERDYTRPTINAEKVLHIQDGRHALQELKATYRPNDTQVGTANQHYVHILVASNPIGKTTYLKELALLCYLAHLGSFVPARFAQIPLLDSIYSRLDYSESIYSGKSSFMSELLQMSGLLQYATSRSLVLVDEFGKGTNFIEGKSLLVASIEHLLQRESQVPICFIATKFTAIREFFQPSPYLSIRSADNDARATQNTSKDTTHSFEHLEPFTAAYLTACRAVTFTMLYHYQTTGDLLNPVTVRQLIESVPITQVAQRCLDVSRTASDRSPPTQSQRNAAETFGSDSSPLRERFR